MIKYISVCVCVCMCYVCMCMFNRLDLNCAYALKLDYNIMFYEVKRFINVIKFYI